MDIDAVDDAEVPDTAPPRGWGVNEKYIVWSDSVANLYEEGPQDSGRPPATSPGIRWSPCLRTWSAPTVSS